MMEKGFLFVGNMEKLWKDIDMSVYCLIGLCSLNVENNTFLLVCINSACGLLPDPTP